MSAHGQFQLSIDTRPTGCPGWTVQDVVSHMACSFWLAVDMSKLPDSTGLSSERAADLYVGSRRSMTPKEVLTDYETASSRGLEIMAAIQGQDVDVPLGDVGTYPAAIVPTAYAFEHYVHIRYDLFSPDGPFGDEPPASDALRLAPTLDWIEAALPQQNRELLDGLNDAVEVRLSSVESRTLTIGGGDVSSRIDCDAAAFVRWVTQRGSWESLGIDAKGDPADLGIARRLHVF
ncbi:maleylpyruvate isomerase family mycothiol-dependent enzyme [Mycobacterium paraterrae]|uniref:Maleylpyruvate isomerase family mycothiol-dependent enzyme n=1 Tax=Mycobacterium paraterrae TaxID=577492 RepID=A0ABY3VHS9_9MYCO|nr:maleylpyruvate isomerase family mycothiol-dependent enzyme [Mycobacterium paraterrae]UMB68967.1 maleylpyruvate isomerase family mycothiol-dependent enzyme [Mycobacterium paraterrae]